MTLSLAHLFCPLSIGVFCNKHHGSGEDGGQGVGLVFAGDIRSRTVAGLKNTRAILTQTSRGEHTERSNEHGCLVTDDVAKYVAANDSIELLRITNDLHRAIVDVHVAELDLGEVLLHN